MRYLSIFILFLSLSACQSRQTVLSTATMNVTINSKGNITGWHDTKSGKDYFPKGQPAPLLSLYIDSVYISPVSFSMDEAGNIALTYPNGSVANITFDNKQDYLRFELKSLEPRNGTKAVVWGPYPVVIDHLIGETIGVVRDNDFAIGVQALNINTIEGIPENGDDAGFGYFIEPLPGQVLPDSLRNKIGTKVELNVNITGDMPEYVRLYRGSAAIKRPYGSELRLFSRDRRIPRTINTGNNVQYVLPVDVDFVGSAIALFGCPEPQTLDMLEKIELGEGLPHPTIDGVWIKRWPLAGQAYLMYEGRSHEKCMEYAKAFGFKLVHIGDFFKSWGHFDLKTPRFPNGAEDIKKFTDKARDEGILLGVHTLTMFTSTHDPYVSPIPSDSLCKTGSSILSKEVGINDSIIYIENPEFFYNMGSTHTAKIGKELISYRSVSADKPYRLVDCIRGQFGTTKANHAAGAVIDKLANNDYNGFFPDIYLQDAFSDRLSEVCNETGIGLMDFDGYGGGSPNGHGCYAAAKFIDRWYRNLDGYRIACGASTFHYYWHIYMFMNWGEPWYNALRESQVNYRIENQRYYERNMMPGMLGWFSVGSDFRPEEMEWIQARSAAFDAGYLLRVDESIEKSGFKEQLFEVVREWQNARHAKAFTKEQREQMKNPKNEFHLEKAGENLWTLYPVTFMRGFEHKFRMVQTGEPVVNALKFDNKHPEQPVQFYITAQLVEGNRTATVSNLRLEFNNYFTVELEGAFKAGDKIYCDGKGLYLCDAQWNKIKPVYSGKLPVWNAGENNIAIKSDFSGNNAPTLVFEFKFLGKGEEIGLR